MDKSREKAQVMSAEEIRRCLVRISHEILERDQKVIRQLALIGIRRGGDVIKALALGAKSVLIGRAYAYGLGAAGGLPCLLGGVGGVMSSISSSSTSPCVIVG